MSTRRQHPPGSRFAREVRYTVLKNKDLATALTETERDQLERLCAKVQAWRTGAGKLPLECVVVEVDWPEYEPTWEAIERRMIGGPPEREPIAVIQDGTLRWHISHSGYSLPTELLTGEWPLYTTPQPAQRVLATKLDGRGQNEVPEA